MQYCYWDFIQVLSSVDAVNKDGLMYWNLDKAVSPNDSLRKGLDYVTFADRLMSDDWTVVPTLCTFRYDLS